MENYTNPFVMATQTTNNRSASQNHRHEDNIIINLAQEISVIKHKVGELATQIKEFILTQNFLYTLSPSPNLTDDDHEPRKSCHSLVILVNVTTTADSGQRQSAGQHLAHTTLETTRETSHPATCSCGKP